MNIQTLADNLRRTIAGKEQMLFEYQDARETAMGQEDAAIFAVIQFLKINIDELKKILADVEAIG